MGTVEADVKIGRTAYAGLAKPDGIAGRELDVAAAGMATHAQSLRQEGAPREGPAAGPGGSRSAGVLEFPATAADDPRGMTERKPPIRSTQEDVPELVQAIDRFVIGLAERIDEIQDAELQTNHVGLSRLAQELAIDSERLGYPGLALVARNAVAAASDGKRDAVQDAVGELTEIAQRVRQGHRGAA